MSTEVGQVEEDANAPLTPEEWAEFAQLLQAQQPLPTTISPTTGKRVTVLDGYEFES